jgi:hypothetical protein
MGQATHKVWYNGEWVDPVAAAAAADAKHRGLRTYGDHEVPAYLERAAWPARPTGVNNYAGKQPLPEHCKAEDLTFADLKMKGPNGAPTGECFQLDKRSANQTQPVLPTLFMPGFPKSASTWLFECMHAAFVPEMVCDRDLASPPPPTSALGSLLARGRLRLKPSKVFAPPFDPQAWSKTGCQGRRFMLPGIACAVTGGCSHRKELFFYGAGYGDYFRVGMAALHGPELPLELFVKEEKRPAGMKGRDWDYSRVRRFEQFCTDPKYTHLPPGRMHPSCCIAKASWPKRWGCRWHESLRLRFGKYQSIWFQTAMPWVRPDEYEFASVDFTPNYLCSAKALRNIHSTARDPSELRFIVLMRDPIMRAFSEWSMFTTWGWDKEKSFLKRTTTQMRNFNNCNSTLAGRPDLLMSLSDEELFAYMGQCFRGMAMEYVTNSLYPICIAGALRIFKREQFLFLRFEDLMRMKAPALLSVLSNFTGLYTDDQIVRKVREMRECEAGRAKKVPLSFTQKGNASAKAREAREGLANAIPSLEQFFAPYDKMLQQLVHPAFQWGPETHKA